MDHVYDANLRRIPCIARMIGRQYPVAASNSNCCRDEKKKEVGEHRTHCTTAQLHYYVYLGPLWFWSHSAVGYYPGFARNSIAIAEMSKRDVCFIKPRVILVNPTKNVVKEDFKFKVEKCVENDRLVRLSSLNSIRFDGSFCVHPRLKRPNCEHGNESDLRGEILKYVFGRSIESEFCPAYFNFALERQTGSIVVFSSRSSGMVIGQHQGNILFQTSRIALIFSL